MFSGSPASTLPQSDRIGDVRQAVERNRAPRHALVQHDDVARRLKRPDHVVRSTPVNVVWGEFPSDRTPIAFVSSGEDQIGMGSVPSMGPAPFLLRSV